jgi:hypothetical protein
MTLTKQRVYLLLLSIISAIGNVFSADSFILSDVVLLKQNTLVNVSGNQIIKKHNFQILINQPTGEKYSKVNILYSKLIKISDINAFITDMNGNFIKKLQKSDVKDHMYFSNISFYDDYMLKEFLLTNNTYPYILNYSYTEIAHQFLDVDFWIPVLNDRICTIDAELKMTIPKNYSIRYHQSPDCKMRIDSTDKTYSYHWKASYTPQKYNYNYATNYIDNKPNVRVVPANFKFEANGSFESWSSYGNWQWEVLKSKNDLPIQEKTILNKLTIGISDNREKIRKLYHYLQDNTRYINISTETGGMIPYPASYVAEKKYGDCKALTNYFKTVLENAGIKSYYADVHAGSKIRSVLTEFPSQQFNHVILYIPLKEDTLWLDCTSDMAFGYLGTFTQGRNVLVIDKEQSRILQIPALLKKEVEDKRKIIVEETGQNNAEISYQCMLKGRNYEMLHGISQNYSTTDQTDFMKNHYISGKEELVNFQITLPQRDSAFVLLNYNTKNKSIFKKYGEELLISTISIVDDPEIDDKIEQNIQIDYPVYRTDTVIIHFKNVIQPANLPEPVHIASDYGEYNFRYNIIDKNIYLTKSYFLKSGRYQKKDSQSFYDFLKTTYNIDKNISFLLHP